MTAKERKIQIKAAQEYLLAAGYYVVPKEQFKVLGEVAADAYKDYPLHNWFFNGKYDPVASRLIMEISLKSMKNQAVIFADSSNLNGFSVWLPPGFKGSKTLPFLLNGGIRLIFHSGPGIISKLLTYETYAMKLRKSFTDNNDWYLYNLSVLKQKQGQGLGKKLTCSMLDFLKTQNAIAYLETNKAANVDLYKHLGFELLKQDTIPKSNVSHYAMLKKYS